MAEVGKNLIKYILFQLSDFQSNRNFFASLYLASIHFTLRVIIYSKYIYSSRFILQLNILLSQSSFN